MTSAQEKIEKLSTTAKVVIAALIASLVIWFPTWEGEPAFGSTELGQDSEIDYYGAFSSAYALHEGEVIPGSGAFTVEAWAWVTGTATDWQAIASQNQNPSGESGFFLGVSSGSTPYVHVAWASSGGWTSCNSAAGSLPVESWFHVGATYNGTNIVVYIDGQQVISCTANGVSMTGTDRFVTGARYDVGSTAFQFMSGRIDQIKVWSTALTEANMAASMHTKGAPAGTSGLLAEYDFNEGTGSTIYDRIGSLDLTATGVTFADVKTISTVSSDVVVTFPRSYLPGLGGWKVPQGVSSAQILAIAGGGAGGTRHGGGGGAGELAISSGYPLTPADTLAIRIGMGGRGYPASTSTNTARSGQPTTFSSVTLRGGGGGRLPGGSGGGSHNADGGGTAQLNSATANLSFFGNNGGAGITDADPNTTNDWAGGGGGGAGSAGGNASGTAVASRVAGDGGSGTISAITGTSACYAAGGGGGAGFDNRGSGVGGSCTGFSSPAGTGGNSTSQTASSALPNTGSGGGGGGYYDGTPLNNWASGSGGSGFVVVRFTSVISISVDSTLGFGQSTTVLASGGIGSGSFTFTDSSGNCTVSGTTVTMKQNSSGSCNIVATKAADTSGGYPEQSSSTTITPENRIELADFSAAVSSITALDPIFYVQSPTISQRTLVATMRVSGSGTLTMGSTGQNLIANEANLATSVGFSNLTGVSEISLLGTVSLLDQALSDVSYTAPSSGTLAQIILDVVEVPSGSNFYFNSSNGHYYEYVNGNISFSDAELAAEAKTLFGRPGYLVTITTAQENSFVADKTTATNIWIGASDRGVEGTWKWVGGPEDNVTFFTGNSSAGTTASGYVAFWASGEPNDAGSNEDYAVTNWGGTKGRWNDLPNSYDTVNGYLVEYGGQGAFTRINASRTVAVSLVSAAGAPTALAASASTSHATVTLSWTAPASDGGSAITDYLVEYRPLGGSWTSYSDAVSTALSATVTNLQPCVAHEFRVKSFNGFQYSATSATASATPVWGSFATLSGVVISATNSECVVTFTSTFSNTWSPPAGTDTIRALVVGGGGGGGAHVGGGGGGGGFIEDYVSVTPGQGVSVQVGAGGRGGALTGTGCTNAENSSTAWSGTDTTWCGHSTRSTPSAEGTASTFSHLTALGGGRGGHWSYISPSSGGSGGGGSYGASYATTNSNPISSGAGLGTTAGGYVQGFAGAAYSSTNTTYGTGGGGGAGGTPTRPTSSTPGNGGPGRASTISGNTVYYAGGGGGGNHNAGSAGTGQHGGGDGVAATSTLQSVQNGAANSGGGGGGGGHSSLNTSAGGNGGSGVIILRQVTVETPAVTAQPQSVTKAPGDSVEFSVSATAPFGTLSYQWQLSTDNGTSWTNIGSNTNSYSISSALAEQDNYSYRVIVTATANGENASVTSNVATLNVSGATVGAGLCSAQVSTLTGVTVSETADGGCLLKFTSPGTNRWTVPNNVSSVEVLVVGGGGGGAGGRGGSWFGGGGGGGGGASIKTSLAVTTSQNISLNVGAGGTAGGNNASGSNGQSSSFSASHVVANGGTGGNRSLTSGVGGFGGAGASGVGTALAGGLGGDGADGLGTLVSQRPTFGAAANRIVFAGDVYCLGGGGGGGNRGVDNSPHFYYQALGGRCTADSLTSGGAGRFYNGTAGITAYFGADSGVTNTGGGGGGGSYTSGGGSAGANGGSGLVAIYYVPGAGSVVLSQPSAISYSADANVSINLSKESSGAATWTSSDTSVCTVSGNNSSATAVVKGTGICFITVNVAAAAGFSAGSSQVSFRIDKVNQAAPTWDNATITAAFASSVDLYEKLFNPSGSNYSFTVAGAGCSVTGFNLTLGNAGTSCTVTPIAGETSVYNSSAGSVMTVSVTKISQSALVITSGTSFNVGSSFTVSAAGGTGGGALSYHVQDAGSTGCTINPSSGEVTATSAGNCHVYAKRASSTNYDEATSSTQAIVVHRISQTLLFTSIPPVTVVTGNTYTVEATASSLLSVAYSITSGAGTVCSITGSTITFLGSGDCVIAANQSGNGSYLAATAINQTVAVGRANQVMTFSEIADQLWGSVAFSLSATVSSGLVVAYSKDAQTTNDACDVSSAGVVTIKNVGLCAIMAQQSGNASYGSVSITRLFEINAQQAGKPAIGSISFGDRELTAFFFRPSYLGGGTVATYELRAYDTSDTLVSSNNGCAAAGITNSCTVTGLTNGETYVLKVAAITQAGVGVFSDSSSEIIPAANPEAVRNLIAIEGDGQLLVQWQQPTSFGGSTFFQYRLYWKAPGEAYQADNSPGATVTSQSTLEYLITGLNNGVAYDVKVVTATMVNNAELQSNTAEVNQSPYTVPNSPANVTVLDNGPSIVIAWGVPTFDGGNPIQQYVVLKDGATACTITSVTTTSCEVAKPAAGTTANFEVKAGNDAGLSTPGSASFTVASLGSSSGGGSGGSGGSGGGGSSTGGGSGATQPIIPIPQPGGGGTSTASPIGFEPRQPQIPVTESGPVGSVGTSSERVVFVQDTKSPAVIANSGDWEMKISSINTSGQPQPLGEKLALQLDMASSLYMAGEGLKPDTVVEIWVFSSPIYLGSIAVKSDGSFDAAIPIPNTLHPGNHTLQLGMLDSQNRIVRITLPLLVKGVVSFGNFKGFIALYSKDLEGQRISFKVAGKWLIQDPVVRFKNFSYSRLTRFTGPGRTIKIDVFINRKFFKTFTTKTR